MPKIAQDPRCNKSPTHVDLRTILRVQLVLLALCPNVPNQMHSDAPQPLMEAKAAERPPAGKMKLVYDASKQSRTILLIGPSRSGKTTYRRLLENSHYKMSPDVWSSTRSPEISRLLFEIDDALVG